MPDLVNVPNVDGIPAVLFAPGSGGDILLAAADAIGLPVPAGLFGQEWGLFLRGRSVIAADTLAAFDHKAEWAIADYPLERGAFESYNKVKIPFDVRFVFVAGGSEANRAALIRSVEAIAGDLKLYDAVTPEKVYPSVNVIHHDVRRTAVNGNGLVFVAVWCQEVRSGTQSRPPSAEGQTGETAAPSGADQANDGTVQAAPATTGEAASANVGPQAFAGGYNVGGYNPDGGTLGNGSFATGIDFSNQGDLNTTVTGDVGEITVQDGETGEVLIQGEGPAATTSSISKFPPAGPDQFSYFNPL